MLNWMKQQAAGLDKWTEATATRTARAARIAGIRDRQRWMEGRDPQTVVEALRTQNLVSDKEMPGVEARLRDEATRRQVINEYRSRMNRGPAMKSEMGINEGLNHLIANNVYVRRGVLPAAVGGGAVLAGAGVTAGAQQLMALMEFMTAGQQQRERVEESPLA